MKNIFFVLLLLAISSGVALSVAAREEISSASILATFEFSGKVTTDVLLPTVIELPISDPSFQRGSFALFEEATQTFQPVIFGERARKNPLTLSIAADQNTIGNISALVDGKADFAEFPISTEAENNSVTLDLTTNRQVTISGFQLELEPFVALPKTVEVSAVDASGVARIILAKTSLLDRSIRFPQSTGDHYRIRFEYAQPLRIREITFFNEEAPQLEGRYLRFLARPGEQYRLYFSADRGVSVPTGEPSNLSDNRDVKRIGELRTEKNVLFVPADADSDGVRDTLDNCVQTNNADQRDENSNGRGDVCDDYDKDGLINSRDNCPAHPNRDQRDTDGDSKGDVCDGEESRITESRPWLPWAAMGIGVIVIVGLFVATAKRK